MMSSMEVLALIPARGGSRGIPRKNLVPIAGRPLVVRSIEHARAASCITRIIVSTEDQEIAAVARKGGAEVPFFRPPELAEDHVLDHPVFLHVLESLDRNEGYRPDLIVHLRPTAPHRKPEWIHAAVERLKANPEADSVRSVSRVAQHPYRMFTTDGENYLQPFVREPSHPYQMRRQDLPEIYYYNCVIDVTRPDTILKKNSMTGDRMLPFFMDPDEVFDIDTMRDLEVARFLLEEKS